MAFVFYFLGDSLWRRESCGRKEAVALEIRLEKGSTIDPVSDGEDINGTLGRHVSLGLSISL